MSQPKPEQRQFRTRRPGSALGASALTSLVILSVSILPAAAQYTPFGQNKVQYTSFQWQVLKSRHFRLFYYEDERALAGQALEMAEASYAAHREHFAMDVEDPIPLIIYSSHQDFEQTNVTPIFLPEGVAGLTEYAKGRVLVPFDGSYSAFQITIQHELVHVFQRELLDRVYREHFRSSPLIPPSWVTEGMAVHWSEKRDADADMVLRDLVLSGALPSIREFWRYEGTYTMYKLGQSVLDYIGDNYGDDRVRLLYERVWAWDDFNEVIKDAVGVSVEELSEHWANALQRRYYPQVAEEQPVGFFSRALTAAGGADFKPLPLPATLPGYGHHFAFLSPRNGYTNIYTASRRGEEPEQEVRTLVEGERRPEFESFHAFRSRMDVSATGLLLFVSQHRGSDEIEVYSIPRRKVIESYSFAPLTGLSSPGWAADGERFVFSGLSRDGYSDLYLFDRRTRKLTRLTFDRYQDLDPSFCPWGEAVVWSSDRTPHGLHGASNLFLLDLTSGRIRYLTRGNWNDRAPVCDPATRGIYFVSDRSGIYQAYWINESGDGRQLTHGLEALLDPRPVPGESALLATVFQGGSFQVRSVGLADSSGPAVHLAPADTTHPWDWRPAAPEVPSEVAAYRSRYTLDLAQGGALFDPAFQAGEGMQAAFSDVMGDHLIFVGLGNNATTTEDLLRNFSADVTYVNRSRRLNYGLSAFHYAGDFYDELGFPFYESRTGLGAFLRYPLNKYERIETNLAVAYDETNRPSTGFIRSSAIGVHSVSYIRDTSLWLASGPIDGQRINLTAGVTLDLASGEAENTMLLGDYRRYLRLGLFSGYAVRAMGAWSEGPNPQFFLLGGSLSLRNWPERYFSGTRELLLNQEVRFPLLRGVVLGLPLGNLELPGVQGAVYLDGGSAWDEGWPPPWDGSYGFGFRMGFGGFLVLRVDMGRRTDFVRFDRHTYSAFYIGWNY